MLRKLWCASGTAMLLLGFAIFSVEANAACFSCSGTCGGAPDPITSCNSGTCNYNYISCGESCTCSPDSTGLACKCK